jgi:hypothetical protein
MEEKSEVWGVLETLADAADERNREDELCVF